MQADLIIEFKGILVDLHWLTRTLQISGTHSRGGHLYRLHSVKKPRHKSAKVPKRSTGAITLPVIPLRLRTAGPRDIYILPRKKE